MPSPYILEERDAYSYEFITDQQVRYSIYFLDYSDIFSGYPRVAGQVYMFNIDVISGDPDTLALDERIGITILNVFNLFFENRHNVAIYVCDQLDQRHLARKRKFDSWFWRYNDGSLIKEDDLAVVEGVEIYNSLILHKENKNLIEVILAFKELNSKANEK